MSAKNLRRCPECKKAKLQRLIGTGAGIIFKGSGFYETDYKRAGESRPKESDSSSTDSSKTETKTESTGGSSESTSAEKPTKKTDD